MKFIIFSVLLFSFAARAGSFDLQCHFFDQDDEKDLPHCAEKTADGYRISPEILKTVEFNEKGLASGKASDGGCFWIAKIGKTRRTYCYGARADFFQDGLARIIDARGKYGYMNEKLDVALSPRYTFAYPFQTGRAKVCVGCKVEKIGKYAIPSGGTWSIINYRGEILSQCRNAKVYEECKMP